METPAPRRARRLGSLAVAMVMGTALVGALAPAAFAQESNDSDTPAAEGRPQRPQLTDEQKSCLEEQGVEKPEPNADGERIEPTDEQRAAFRAAAEACGIELPAPRHPRLTDEQKSCLEEQGVEKPEPNADGERVEPTEEQRAAFRAAAEACGIELPAPRHPRLTDEQKSCLEEQGIEKPARGEDGERVEPTDEQRAAFRAAAETCGIDLPDSPPSDSSDAS